MQTESPGSGAELGGQVKQNNWGLTAAFSHLPLLLASLLAGQQMPAPFTVLK